VFTDLLSGITTLIEQHAYAAYALIFLLAMSEALPGIGIVVPGTAVILAVSALIPAGVVKLWPMLAATASGAIVGDGLSFWLGHRYQRALLSVWPLDRYPAMVEKGEAFFARHGNMGVFLARFIPGVRAVVPLLAGIVGMAPWRFYLANVLSAVVWTLSHVLPAVFVGAAFAEFGTAAKPLAILLALIIVLLWLAWKLLRWALRYGLPLLVRILARTRGWARRGDGIAAGTVSHLMGRTPGDAIALLVAGIVIIAAAWIFLGTLEDVVNGDPLVHADNSVFQGLRALRTGTGDAIMISLTELGDTVVVSAVTAAVFLLLVLRRAFRSALFLLIAVAGGSLVNTVIKGTLHRARPGEMAYRGWSEFSFPSGHSTLNAILYGFLAVLIAREVRPGWRLPIAFAAMLIALSIAFSRVYLGAHWFSDVVAGLSFGTLWLTTVSFILLRGRQEAVGPARIAIVAGMALLVAGGLDIHQNRAADMRRYAVQQPIVTVPLQSWLQDDWKLLPASRTDITGEDEEPLTLQIAGALADIESRLAAKGWKEPPSLLSHASAWLAPRSGPDELPVFPLLASGRAPDLVMIRPDPQGGRARMVLRLWQSDLSVDDGQLSPVWFASVVHEQLSTFGWMATRAVSDQDYSRPRDVAAAAFTTVSQVKSDEPTDGWDGKLDLIRADPIRSP
jgi:undecaprenyl-diphosphatase